LCKTRLIAIADRGVGGGPLRAACRVRCNVARNLPVPLAKNEACNARHRRASRDAVRKCAPTAVQLTVRNRSRNDEGRGRDSQALEEFRASHGSGMLLRQEVLRSKRRQRVVKRRVVLLDAEVQADRKSTRLNSSHDQSS